MKLIVKDVAKLAMGIALKKSVPHGAGLGGGRIGAELLAREKEGGHVAQLLQVAAHLVINLAHHAKVNKGQRKVNVGSRWTWSHKNVARMRVGVKEPRYKKLFKGGAGQLGGNGVGVDSGSQ